MALLLLTAQRSLPGGAFTCVPAMLPEECPYLHRGESDGQPRAREIFHGYRPYHPSVASAASRVRSSLFSDKVVAKRSRQAAE